MKDKIKLLLSKFSTIATILPLLVLAVDIFTTIDEKIKKYNALQEPQTPAAV